MMNCFFNAADHLVDDGLSGLSGLSGLARTGAGAMPMNQAMQTENDPRESGCGLGRLPAAAVAIGRPTLTLILGLMLVATLFVAGCATQASRSDSAASKTAVETKTAPADPRQWIGRWQGAGGATLTIMPSADGRYRVDLRSDQGITTHYRATASGGRLYFQRVGKALAIRSGRGGETGNPALAGLSNCLLIVPGSGGYCRRAGSAAGLPLAPGAYVTVKTACNAARSADTLYFTGSAIARPGQKACRASTISQQGMIFHLDDHCAAGGASGGVNETIAVPDAHHMAVQTRGQPVKLYRYCATGLLPPMLRAAALRQESSDLEQ